MSETLFRGKIITVKRLDGRWEVVEHAAAVAILVERDGRVLGVRQDRPAVGAATWELPAGLIDPGEEPSRAAARELAEEARLGGTLELLSRVYASPGFTDEEIFLFRASDLYAAEAEPDEGEDLTVEWRDPAEVWAAVARGELKTSAVTALGIRHALAERASADRP